MNDDFLTNALQQNRYLKAIQLINRFETELRDELELIGNEFVQASQDLFAHDVQPKWNKDRSAGPILAFARVDYEMDRVTSDDADERNLKLNISFRWVEPADIGVRDDEGVLTILSYKIKRATPERHRQVKEQTEEQDFDVSFAPDPYSNSPGIVYYPVETAQDLETAHRELLSHFSQFGGEYGDSPEKS